MNINRRTILVIVVSIASLAALAGALALGGFLLGVLSPAARAQKQPAGTKQIVLTAVSDTSIRTTITTRERALGRGPLLILGDGFLLLRFPVDRLGIVPSQLVAARLELYQEGGIGWGRTGIKAQRITDMFSESSIVGDGYWSVYEDGGSMKVVQAPRTFRHTVTLDVTAAVRVWLGGFPNHGFVVSGQHEPPPRDSDYKIAFFSREGEQADNPDLSIVGGFPGVGPRLRIFYTPTLPPKR